MGVSASAVVSMDRLPNHLLSLGLELMLVLRAPSPTNTKFMDAMFMATYLLPTASGPSLVRGPQVGLSVGGLRFLRLWRLGETLLRLSILKSVCLWGVLTLVHLWGVLRFLCRLRLPSILKISPPRIGTWHFSSRGIWLLPWHLLSGTPT